MRSRLSCYSPKRKSTVYNGLRNCKAALKIFAAVLALSLPAASPALAQIAGGWHITGKFGSRDFVLDCHFQPQGSNFGGVCIEPATADSPSKTRILTKSAVAGDQISWSYPVSFMFYKFDANFAGILKGNNIAGTIDIKGHEGVFSGTRK